MIKIKLDREDAYELWNMIESMYWPTAKQERCAKHVIKQMKAELAVPAYHLFMETHGYACKKAACGYVITPEDYKHASCYDARGVTCDACKQTKQYKVYMGIPS